MKGFGKTIFWVLVIAVVFIAAYTVYSGNSAGEAPVEPLQQKKMAADFALKDMEGKTVKLSDYKGKVVFVNFWASWCPPCKAEMPDFNKANAELQKKNEAVILSVNITDGVRETEEKARKYLNDNKINLHVLFDQGGKLASSRDYNISAIPTTFIINKDGSIYSTVTGPMTEKTILDLTKKLK